MSFTNIFIFLQNFCAVQINNGEVSLLIGKCLMFINY